MESINSNDEKNKSLLLEYQNNFIRNWTKIKIDKFSESYYKSWDPLTEIPHRAQLLLNFYFDIDINNNVIEDNNFQKALEKLELITNDIDKEDEREEILKNQFLSVKFKNNRKEIEKIDIKINKTA